jgi:hypothetical protein
MRAAGYRRCFLHFWFEAQRAQLFQEVIARGLVFGGAHGVRLLGDGPDVFERAPRRELRGRDRSRGGIGKTGRNRPVERSTGDDQKGQEGYCSVRPEFRASKHMYGLSFLASRWKHHCSC